MSFNPRDPDSFYAKLRSALMVYGGTEDPLPDLAARFRRDLVHAWTAHQMPDMPIPSETPEDLLNEVLNKLGGLTEALQAAAGAHKNASELLVSQVCPIPPSAITLC